MTSKSIKQSREENAPQRVVDVALITTTVALVVSLVIAATVVSIGIARADALGEIANTGDSRFALGVFVAFVISAMGILTAILAPSEGPARRD